MRPIWHPTRPPVGSDAREKVFSTLKHLGRSLSTPDSIESYKRLADSWPEKTLSGRNQDGDPEQVGTWFRGDVCPSDENLWYLARALQKIGRPWCSGYGLLWACGRYATCVHIIALFQNDKSVAEDEIDQVWQITRHSDKLYAPLFLDTLDPKLAAAYLTSEAPSHEGINLALEIVRASTANTIIDWTPGLDDYIFREELKLRHRIPEKTYDKLSKAVRQAFAYTPVSGLHTIAPFDLLLATFLVADSFDIDLDAKKIAVLALLSQCVSAHKLGRYQGQRFIEKYEVGFTLSRRQRRILDNLWQVVFSELEFDG